MKKLLFLLIGVVLVAAAAFGVRQSGVDLAGLLDKAWPGLMGQSAQQASAPAQTQGGQGQGQGQGQRPNRGPSPVETARASSSQLSDDISGIGTLLAEESVDIAPETSGRVAEILFEDGATVAEVRRSSSSTPSWLTPTSRRRARGWSSPKRTSPVTRRSAAPAMWRRAL